MSKNLDIEPNIILIAPFFRNIYILGIFTPKYPISGSHFEFFRLLSAILDPENCLSELCMSNNLVIKPKFIHIGPFLRIL